MDNLVIGDVHGHLEPLEALLEKAGFNFTNGAWRNPDCRAIFLGDFIDRGPQQLEVLDLVRRMLDAGSAVACMGNHEFNAIAWATEDRDAVAEGHLKHYRARNENNYRTHRAFLEAVGNDSPLHKEMVAWFASLPLWLDLPDLRAVHACWHKGHQEALLEHLDDNLVLTEEGLHAVFRKGTEAYKAAEVVLKGPEILLPPGVSYVDGDGTQRTKTRVRWWQDGHESYRSAALVDETTALQLPDDPLPPSSRVELDDGKPLFFGHYWFSGTPFLISEKRTCLDFSIVKDGYLAGYLLRAGEQLLSEENLIWAGAGPRIDAAPSTSKM